MPELPDIMAYRDCLRQRLVGATIESVLVRSPFVLRTYDPPVDAVEGKRITGVSTLAKRIVIECEDELALVIHLMISGRFRWCDAATKPGLPSKIELARFKTTAGTLILTEASQKKRASLHIVRGEAAQHGLDPGGVDPISTAPAKLIEALREPNRTIKRALTDPRVISGIGNAYSDEILHAARISPITHTSRLTPEEWSRLTQAIRDVLTLWTEKLHEEFAGSGKFPGAGEITAFRPDFAVHGKFGKPCPVCGSSVQRIVRAENEVNYCPTCQNGGRILADRSLSRLLGEDWPRTVEEWEEQM